MASEEHTNEVRALIDSFCRLAQLPPWDGPVNERVAEIFGVMVSETVRCSDAFKWFLSRQLEGRVLPGSTRSSVQASLNADRERSPSRVRERLR